MKGSAHQRISPDLLRWSMVSLDPRPTLSSRSRHFVVIFVAPVHKNASVKAFRESAAPPSSSAHRLRAGLSDNLKQGDHQLLGIRGSRYSVRHATCDGA